MKKFKGFTVHLEEFKGFTLGEKVRLPADEDFPEQFGEVVCLKKNHAIVVLDKKYREGKHDDGQTEVDYSEIESIKSTKKSEKESSTTKTKNTMKKSAKKSAKKVAKKSTEKKTANRPAAKRDGDLTRGEAADLLKISIYAVDQALAKNKLKGLSKDQVMSFKKAAKA